MSLELRTPAFKYQLIDFSKYSIEVIKHRLFDLASVKRALLVLKYISNPEALEKSLKEFFEVGRIYFEDDRGLIFLETVIKYVYQFTEIDTGKE